LEEAMLPKRVLVADDSRIFRMLVAEVLRDQGIGVIEAANGREALDHTLSERPELLILDALMPLLSGFDVLSKLREKAPDYEPIVFIVTAVYKSRRWESEARQTYRVHEYLEKPIEPEELLKTIARYFSDVHA
jgi:response regulator RpfG family c-di-GMP phosphodiesterase